MQTLLIRPTFSPHNHPFSSFPPSSTSFLLARARRPQRYYAKRCFLALAENMAKHMLMLKDSSMHEILSFLDAADQHGAKIPTVIAPSVVIEGQQYEDQSTHNVSFEARQIKKLYLKLRE